MKAIILVPFQDVYKPEKIYKVDEVVEFSDSRVAELLPRNFIKIIPESPVVPKAPKVQKRTQRA